MGNVIFKNKFIKKFTLTTLSLCTILICSSWGFLMHRTIQQLAIYHLPPTLAEFFYSHIEYLVYNSVRPDIRRSSDKNEATKHFIDLENYGWSDSMTMPLYKNEAILKYGWDSLKDYGYVPYQIEDMKKKLSLAFEHKNLDSILFFAADIGHYVSDALVPLHTTNNYDGQLTNQKGLHALWESTIPELELNKFNLFHQHKARYLPDINVALWPLIIQAHNQVNQILTLEKELSVNFPDSFKYNYYYRNNKKLQKYSGRFAKEFYQKIKPSVENQMYLCINLTADIWYSAWVEANSPDLKDMLNLHSKYTSETLKSDLKDYQNNLLISNNKLLSKIKKSSSEE